jgi:hypothetical protein
MRNAAFQMITNDECRVHEQVLHPICSSLRTVDITDTSITNAGLQQLCRRISNLSSLGEYSIRWGLLIDFLT